MKWKIFILMCLGVMAEGHFVFSTNASFTISSNSGCVPHFVSFTNTSTDAVSYVWNLGNGNTSIEVNPVATYTIAGTYTVSLTATGPAGISTISHTITVYAIPVADFSSSPTFGCPGLNVNFNSISQTSGAAITQFQWFFGDGNSQTIIGNGTTQHVYSASGLYSVGLKVTDSNGCFDVESKTDIINVIQVPIVVFSASTQMGCSVPLTVQFTSSVAGAISYSWSFGDGQVSNIANPAHTYTQFGNYQVSLNVTSGLNCSNSLTIPSFIQIQPLVTNFTLDDSICSGTFPSVLNLSTGANQYQWNVDGIISNDLLPTPFSIYSGGNHYISLIASLNGNCTDTLSDSFFVETLQASFTPTFSFFCQIPDSLVFQPSVSSNVNPNNFQYFWTIPSMGLSGNSEIFEPNLSMTSNLQDYQHDEVTVNLQVVSELGCVIMASLPALWIDLPFCDFDINNYDFCAPDIIGFENNCFYNSQYDSIVSWTWQMWDGTIYNSFEPPDDIWPVPGMYSSSVLVTTAHGCTCQFTSEPLEELTTPVIPPFNYIAYDTICAWPAFQFTTDLPIDTTSVEWIFSDGNLFSNEQSPLVYPLDTGTLSVILKYGDNPCLDVLYIEEAIHIQGPISFFNYLHYCSEPNDFLFFPDTNLTVHPITGHPLSTMVAGGFIAVDRFYWDFGDGSPIDSVHTSPLHGFPGPGIYNVILTSYNDSTGCSYQMKKKVRVPDLLINFHINPLESCVNVPVEFNLSGSQDVIQHDFGSFVSLFSINYGDGASQDFYPSNGYTEHAYADTGLYLVTVIAMDTFGCPKTAYREIRIFGPDAHFSGSPTSGCSPLHSLFYPGMWNSTLVSGWEWFVNGSLVSDSAVLDYTFYDGGNYDITLVAFDGFGCRDTFIRPHFVEVGDFDISINASSTVTCPFETIKLWVEPPVPESQVHWIVGTQDLFGDTVYFNPQNPGDYNVLVQITSHGCTKEYFYPTMLKVGGTMVNFTMGGDINYCYPAFVEFEYTTVGPPIVYYLWDFGDGTTSGSAHPLHVYEFQGIYTVSLTTTAGGGCDPFIQYLTIRVLGPEAELSVDSYVNCLGDSIQFNLINSTYLAGYALDFGDGSPLTTQLPASHVYFNAPLNGTVYANLLFWTADSACVGFSTDSLMFLPVRAWFSRGMDGLDSDTTGCEPFELGILNQSIGADIFHWSFGDGTSSSEVNPVHTYLFPGDYDIRLEVWNQQYGCHFANAKQVSVFETPDTKISGETQVCIGSEIQFFSNGIYSLAWQPASVFNNPSLQNPVALLTESSTIILEETNDWNCTGKDSLQIFVQTHPQITVSDTSIIIGQEIQYPGDGPYLVNYEWSPAGSLLCPNCYSPVFQPLEPTMYTVTMTASIDDSVCFVKIDSVYIDVMNKFSVDMPQVFTPNGDGFNDAVYVNGWGLKDLQEYRIFNRWGQCIFSTQDLRKGWDGSFKGNPQPPDSYAYQVIAIGYDGREYSKKGVISLIR